MFVEKGQMEHLDVAVETVSESLYDTMPYVVHQITLSKLATPFQYKEQNDGKWKKFQLRHVLFHENLVHDRLYSIGHCRGKAGNEYHADHSPGQTKPMGLNKFQDPMVNGGRVSILHVADIHIS